MHAITDHEAMELLLKKENVPKLEEILEKQNALVNSLPVVGDAGGCIQVEDITAIALQVKNEVDKFLGKSDFPMPPIEHFSLFSTDYKSLIALGGYGASACVIGKSMANLADKKMDRRNALKNLGTGIGLAFLAGSTHMRFALTNNYDPLTNEINMDDGSKFKYIPLLAHEYAHSILKESGVPTIRKSFHEGFAEQIGSYIATVYAKRESPFYLAEDAKVVRDQLETTYRWMCRRLDVRQKESLLRQSGPIVLLNATYNFLFFDKHDLGIALFMLYEETRGPNICRKLIAGEDVFHS